MNYQLTIGWLYPDLMSIYGDRGNIIALKKRCAWRGIGVTVKPILVDSALSGLRGSDLLFMGGAQDRQQTIVANDLKKKKKVLSEMIEDNIPGLYICGGFQFLGKYYKEADGTVIDQLGILDVWTENPGGERLIGNIAIELNNVISSEVRNLYRDPHIAANGLIPQGENGKFVILGFENHGGRTRLGKGVKPLGKVIKGFGSNAEDGLEGAIYKNSIGTYLHGPVLPKNPILSDWLLQKALEKKYRTTIEFSPLDDSLAHDAHDAILQKMR